MSAGDGGDEAYDPYDDAPEWTDEDEERYQARQDEERRRKKTRRRQALSFTLLVLVVLGAGVVGAGINQGWWEWPFQDEPSASPSSTCGDAAASIAAPADTRVNVLNATDTRGLAAAVGSALTARGYVVEEIGNDSSGVDVTGTVQVRYGPSLDAQAQSVALHFRREALVDDGRTGGVVDLVIGQGFTKLAPAEEAAAAIAAAATTQPVGCGSNTGD